jgi:hypothetical protein
MLRQRQRKAFAVVTLNVVDDHVILFSCFK